MSTTTHQARQVIAGNVRALLGRKRSNQTQLATVLGKSQPAVSRRLSGELAFDTDELLKICEHYQVPLVTLIDGIGTDDDGAPRIHALTRSVQLDLFPLAA